MNLILQVNLIIVMVFIIMCSIGVKSTLDDLRLRVDHELDFVQLKFPWSILGHLGLSLNFDYSFRQSFPSSVRSYDAKA